MKNILSNMAGSVFLVHVNVGDQVQVGQDVVILESMKMEVPISSEVEGTVKEVKVNVGDFVNDGDVVIIVE
jgi:acetyl-CoA carboxylase biotin carboxyl carrier protein